MVKYTGTEALGQMLKEEHFGPWDEDILSWVEGGGPTKHLPGQHDQSSHGNWATGGGAGAIASDHIVRMTEVEPGVTSDLEEVASAEGREMHGLEFRLKSEESLARKIKTDAEQNGMTHEAAASEITDVLRYTMVIESPEDFANEVKMVQAELAEKGYEKYDEKYKNYFGPGDPYDGYNTVVMHQGTGTRLELQFHTPESIAIKTSNWETYNTWRELPSDSPERVALFDDMTNAWEQYQRPIDWETLEGIRMDSP